VGLCLSELQRLDDVVRTVLDVGRPGSPSRGACDAHSVIEETLRMMTRSLADRRIKVVSKLYASRADVSMDAAALRSVVMNLLLNSRDALADRLIPCITVSTRLLDSTGTDPRFELRVSDNGPGIPAHLSARVFDPFFTTKATGNGVGLATAMRAVQECGGVIRCQPADDWVAGAEFVIELPLADSAAKRQALLDAGPVTARSRRLVAAGRL
jgi:signal transduction histidine kinase